jgi:hypothetical protein
MLTTLAAGPTDGNKLMTPLFAQRDKLPAA